MESTKDEQLEVNEYEQLEVNEFSTKYPTIIKLFNIFEKRIDDLDQEVSRLKKHEPI